MFKVHNIPYMDSYCKGHTATGQLVLKAVDPEPATPKRLWLHLCGYDSLFSRVGRYLHSFHVTSWTQGLKQ